jgi:hypothetical protein
MEAVLALAGLAFAAVAVIVVLFTVGLVLKTILKFVLLPLLLIKWVVMAILALIVGPIVFVAGLIGAFAVGLVLALPLLPFVAVGVIVWLIVRSSQRAAVA